MRRREERPLQRASAPRIGPRPTAHLPRALGQPALPVVVFLGRQRHAVQRVMSMQPLLLLQSQALQLGRLCVHGLQLMSC